MTSSLGVNTNSVGATAVTGSTPEVTSEQPTTPEHPTIDPEQAAAWLHLKKRCTDLNEYRKNKNLKVSIDEYMAYIRVLEKRNPTHTHKHILARLHAGFYGYDLNQTVPVIETPLFLHGADTAGYETVDPICKVKIGNRWQDYTPKFVYLHSGEEVDIAHLYAGPRSDMNRGDHNWFSLELLLLANTYLGDYYQIYFDSPTKFPHNQLRGDVLGIWVAQFYRLPHNRDAPFSKAMEQLITELGTSVGAYGRLAHPQ